MPFSQICPSSSITSAGRVLFFQICPNSSIASASPQVLLAVGRRSFAAWRPPPRRFRRTVDPCRRRSVCTGRRARSTGAPGRSRNATPTGKGCGAIARSGAESRDQQLPDRVRRLFDRGYDKRATGVTPGISAGRPAFYERASTAFAGRGARLPGDEPRQGRHHGDPPGLAGGLLPGPGAQNHRRVAAILRRLGAEYALAIFGGTQEPAGRAARRARAQSPRGPSDRSGPAAGRCQSETRALGG